MPEAAVTLSRRTSWSANSPAPVGASFITLSSWVTASVPFSPVTFVVVPSLAIASVIARMLSVPCTPNWPAVIAIRCSASTEIGMCRARSSNLSENSFTSEPAMPDTFWMLAIPSSYSLNLPIVPLMTELPAASAPKATPTPAMAPCSWLRLPRASLAAVPVVVTVRENASMAELALSCIRIRNSSSSVVAMT